MKLRYHIALLMVGILMGCPPSTKTDHCIIPTPISQQEKDYNAIVEHIQTNGLTMEKTADSIFYAITSENGVRPESTDKVQINYSIKALDDTPFFSSEKEELDLSDDAAAIKGFLEAIKLLSEGASGTFIIPSHLAYGSEGFPGKINANEVVKIEVKLLKIIRYRIE